MVYDICENQSTTMAMSKELFTSCKASKIKGPELTEKEFRTNIDTAWRIATHHEEKNHKKLNKVHNPEPVKTCDHPPCQDCGGIFFLRTGTCHVCQTCGGSQGCS